MLTVKFTREMYAANTMLPHLQCKIAETIKDHNTFPVMKWHVKRPLSLTSNTTTHIPVTVVLTKICRHRL